MTEIFNRNKEKKEALKELIKKLHAGESTQTINIQFKELIKDTMPDEITKIEEELIQEGMPREEVHRFYDIHLAVFRETLEKAGPIAPAGHPINILMEEHNMLLKFADDLRSAIKEMEGAKGNTSVSELMKQVNSIVNHFKESELHYLREENILFPYLEKHEITQPPAIMWMEHDQIREIEKTIYGVVDKYNEMSFQEFIDNFNESTLALAEMLSSHFYKENNILFPTSLRTISENEWTEIRQQFDDIGYCCFTPERPEISVEAVETPPSKLEIEGMVSFETGQLSAEVVEAIFNALPVDITFVDKDDTVRYFSQSKERIFVRTKAIIGRKVQQCHPEKSIHIVNQILEDFKNGKRDFAEFWINFEGRIIHIRYFPVFNKNRDYLGCIEATQDITDIKKLEGEKRLL